MSLVHTCTENGISDVDDETRVNDIEPSDSIALLVSFRNWTAKTTNVKNINLCLTNCRKHVCTK